MQDEIQRGADSETAFARARREMIQTQLVARGISDPRVLKAMTRIPRHLFVPPEQREHAYDDTPLPIGHGQTLSQPYVVAFMTEQLELTGRERVLEVGTGSGYQTALLAELARRVFTLEVLDTLSRTARELLAQLGYLNITFAVGDGRRGWPEEASFDAILAAAAAEEVPTPLLGQLSDGGRMILPLGEHHQDLWLFRRAGREVTSRRLLPVRFVPLVHGGYASSQE